MAPISSSFQIENRLIDFVARIQKILKTFPTTYFHLQLVNQISRSSTATALNYAEAESAESAKDFIHKIKIVLKELRECYVSLRILAHDNDLNNISELSALIQENNELIAIFVKSIQTDEKNLKSKNNQQ
jgi:four helix bundle protein